MRQEQIMTLFDYHWSTTERLLELACQLPDESYHAEPENGPGSIHNMLFHLMSANHGWRIGLETGKQQPGLKITDHTDQEANRSLISEERTAWQAYLAQLTDQEINDEVTLITLRGHSRTFPLWFILTHLVLHGMQHHSEIAQVLSAHGHSPGNIDLIFFHR